MSLLNYTPLASLSITFSFFVFFLYLNSISIIVTLPTLVSYLCLKSLLSGVSWPRVWNLLCYDGPFTTMETSRVTLTKSKTLTTFFRLLTLGVEHHFSVTTLMSFTSSFICPHSKERGGRKVREKSEEITTSVYS